MSSVPSGEAPTSTTSANTSASGGAGTSSAAPGNNSGTSSSSGAGTGANSGAPSSGAGGAGAMGTGQGPGDGSGANDGDMPGSGEPGSGGSGGADGAMSGNGGAGGGTGGPEPDPGTLPGDAGAAPLTPAADAGSGSTEDPAEDEGDVVSDGRSPGCGTALDRPQRNVQQTMESGGATRYYLLDVPANADNETPLDLVVALHGFDMNNVAVLDLFNFTQRSGGQAITVLPQGEGPPPGDVSHWGDGVLESTWVAGETNYEYLRALIEDLSQRYCINPGRVFLTGFSMGGFFTNSMACAHSDWFRGFAPVAGGGPQACGDAETQPAIIVQHGTADDIVGIESGEASRDFWVQQNGCSSSSTPTLMGCEAYQDCPADSPVMFCIGNYDHYIPEDVAANIWSFFSSLP